MDEEWVPGQNCDGDTVHTDHLWFDDGDNEWFCDGIIE